MSVRCTQRLNDNNNGNDNNNDNDGDDDEDDNNYTHVVTTSQPSVKGPRLYVQVMSEDILKKDNLEPETCRTRTRLKTTWEDVDD